MSRLRHLKVAIIGGGPGGLTLARLLQRPGINVKVFERDAGRFVRVQGATLDLHEDTGLRALAEAGLMDDFKTRYRPGADALTLTDETGKVFWKDGELATAETGRPEIDRGPLRDLLLSSLSDGTVVWNSHFERLESKAGRHTLHFRNGSSETFDLVVAADGANSKLRPYVTDNKPFYSGVSGIEGSVPDASRKAPGINRLLAGGKIFALSGGKTLIVSSKGDGSFVFYFSFKAPEDWSRTNGVDWTSNQAVKEWFAQNYKGWDPFWLELFEHAEPNYLVRSFGCMPVDDPWPTAQGLTMLGDAAHLMPPFAGEGVNQAMADALDLSQCLLDPKAKDLQNALMLYESRMHRRVKEIVIETLEATETMHSPGALDHYLRFFGGQPL